MRKINIRKHVILSHFSMVKTQDLNFVSKYTPHAIILYLQKSNSTRIFYSMIFLRDQNLFACFLPANQLFKKSKLVLAIALIMHLVCIFHAFSNTLSKSNL